MRDSVQDRTQILEVFIDCFHEVYSSKVNLMEEALVQFLDCCPLPSLTADGRKLLSAPLTIKELAKAVASMANSKSPGTDGLLVEIYKRYSDHLLPVLLETLNGTVMMGHSPPSMNKAVIVVIPKPDKDPVLPDLY